MVNALTPLIYAKCRLLEAPAYDEQIIARRRTGVQTQRNFMICYGFRRGDEDGKKRAAEKIGGF